MSILQANGAGLGGAGDPGGALASSSIYGTTIDQSLRFNDNDSAYLNRTPSSNGNRQIFTYSVWFKVGNTGLTSSTLFSVNDTNVGNYNFIRLNSDALRVQVSGGGSNYVIETNQLFRDVSSWYHLVFSVDTTQATSTDRVKIYINGEQVTSFSSASYPSQNLTTDVNSNTEHRIGSYVDYGRYFDGYMAEINMIDGTALDATSFGETIGGVWVPKAYDTADGAYGTNGFYLSFADSGAIGDDLSGNTNDWTANNLAASDVVLDSPTNNFATFNPLDISGTTLTYSEGNLKAERTTTSFAQAYSSFSFDSGKWYAEYLIDTGNADPGVIAGTTNAAANRYLGQDTFTYGYYRDGRKINSGSYTSYGGSYSVAADGSGDVVGVYIDADAGDIYFSVNGTVQNSGTAAFTGVTGPFRFAADSESGGFVAVNFGQDDTFAGLKTSGSAAASDDNGNGVFYDAIGLSGYLAPCTANLPEPAIGPNSDTTSDQHFNTVLYTGNASTNAITGVGFQPDWVWLKARSFASGHALFDVVRGATEYLGSEASSAESTLSGSLTSFDSDGFSLGSNNGVNRSGTTFASWNWKAGGNSDTFNIDGTGYSTASAASLDGGDITPTGASINKAAGFSVVGYTGNGGAITGQTIKHGLDSAPELIFIKDRDTNSNSNQFHASSSVVGDDYAYLSTTAAFTGAALMKPTSGDSTTVTVGIGSNTNVRNTTNESGDRFIMYCFHSVDGFSKVGSYVGNNSADGPFSYTGFRPAWIMLKRTDSAASWLIYDDKRDTFNQMQFPLFPNNANAEYTSNLLHIDFLSNGFKVRNATYGETNASGGNYIYLAFAEAPFKYANAR